jgi:N-acetylmuramoyl-L-alanine amidase
MARVYAHCWFLAALVAAQLVNGCAAPARALTAATPPEPPSPPARSPASIAPATANPAAPPPAASRPAAPLAPPTRPAAALWPTVRLFGVDRIDVREIATRFGLKSDWVVRDRVLQLSDAGGVRLRFEDRRSDCLLDGTRVFLGEKTVLYKDSLHVGKVDVIKTLAPLLRPGDYTAHLPAPPKVVALDPGHGGNDPGTQNAALRLTEKDLTLDVVLRMKKLLESRGYRVVLTRSADRRVELESRPGLANEAQADLFVSVHFNNAEGNVAGTETYVMTPQFQTSAKPEQDTKMAAVAYPGNRQDFGNALLGYHLHRAVLATLKTSDRGFKRYRYSVLRFPECPAALVEAAFLSNDAEARRFASAETRQKLAEALTAGIAAYAAALPAARP